MKISKNRNIIITNLIKKISVEEKYFLYILTFMLIISIVFSLGDFSFYQYVSMTFAGFKIYFSWFMVAIVMLPLALYLSIVLIIYKINFQDGYEESRSEFVSQLKKLIKNIWLALLIIAIFIFIAIIIGITLKSVNNRLVNQLVYGFEINLFHALPSVWLHTSANPFKQLLDLIAPVVLQVFLSFSTVVAITVGLFLIVKKYDLLTRMVTAFLFGLTLALPIWFMLPINSPNNYYIQEKELPRDYQPNTTTNNFQKVIYNSQKSNKPTTTIPSMHVLWSIVVVYYLGVYKRWFLFVAVPWCALLFLGTFYFAQHYLVDGLLSIPLALMAIFLAEKFTKVILHRS